MTGKSSKRKLHLRRPASVHEADEGRVKRMLAI
ncbi:MAG: 50S ribosomal protein L35 [bacterium]|nr:50S ribosomal protein L35 [bacterium]